MTLQQVLHATVPHKAAKVQYSSDKEFESMAKQLKLMSDLRVSLPNRVIGYGIMVVVHCRLEYHEQHTEALSVSCTKIKGFT